MPNYPVRSLLDVEQETYVSFLDFCRWTAAGLVFVAHLRGPLLLGYSELLPVDRSLIVMLWYFVTGWHAEAVDVFFVLSGFLVGGLACAKAKAGRFSTLDYTIDRLTRLYVAFLPALVLTVVLDGLGVFFLSESGFYDHTHPMMRLKIASDAFDSHMSLQIFFMNVAMLQTFFAPPYGSNQPLWTISAEFWFYAAFGVAIFGLSGPRFVRRGICIGLLCALAYVFGFRFLILFGLWLIGLATAFVPSHFEQPRLSLGGFLIVLVIVRIEQDYFKSTELLRNIKDYVVAGMFAWVLVSMRNVQVMFLERSAEFNRFMANFSYSLYLIHYPFMLFILAALYKTGRFPDISRGYSPASFEGDILYVIVIFIVYLASWQFSLLTERRTSFLRKHIRRLVAS